MAEDWLEAPFSLQDKRIWIAGHAGMVGAALCRRLRHEGCAILTASRDDLDLRNQAVVRAWMRQHAPDVIVIAAAKVGGILANRDYPADFLYDNLMIAANIIHAAHETDVEKLLFLGSSCIYPQEAPQPIDERALLTGPLEPTNEAYALAKIAGIKLCQSYRQQHGRDFVSVMPCNLYGPGDSFDEQTSHVIPALMLKAHIAKTENHDHFTVWGSGQPLREFLYVDDLADALTFVLKRYSSQHILNIGSGRDISIQDLAQIVADTVGFRGELLFDPAKPDGVFRKLMNSERLHEAGWLPHTSLRDGLAKTYAWFLEQNRSITMLKA